MVVYFNMCTNDFKGYPAKTGPVGAPMVKLRTFTGAQIKAAKAEGTPATTDVFRIMKIGANQLVMGVGTYTNVVAGAACTMNIGYDNGTTSTAAGSLSALTAFEAAVDVNALGYTPSADSRKKMPDDSCYLTIQFSAVANLADAAEIVVEMDILELNRAGLTNVAVVQ